MADPRVQGCLTPNFILVYHHGGNYCLCPTFISSKVILGKPGHFPRCDKRKSPLRSILDTYCQHYFLSTGKSLQRIKRPSTSAAHSFCESAKISSSLFFITKDLFTSQCFFLLWEEADSGGEKKKETLSRNGVISSSDLFIAMTEVAHFYPFIY